MNGSGEFQIALSENFERNYQNLIRDRYRKNPAAATEFAALIEQFITVLSVNPRPRPPLGHLEPWPKGSNYPGWELWKLEFKMPQLRGAAGQGRLIYLLEPTKKEVIILWIYTHAEFEKRPPDKNLKRLLLEIMESSISFDEIESFELRSATDDLKMLREKMQEYIDAGVRLGWLINPQEQQVEIYRQGQEVEVRNLPTELSGEVVLPGFTLSLARY